MNPPPPPPPPPPPAVTKSPIAATNKALLSSIEKGTKLKKVPDALKNDRSVVTITGSSDKNVSNSVAVNGNQSLSGQAKPNLFSDIQSQLANHMSSMNTTNVRKSSLNSNASPMIKIPMKSNVPAPNQYVGTNNKPPPPPPFNKKPNSGFRNSISEPVSRPILSTPNNVERVISQGQVIRKVQPPIPSQLSTKNPIHNQPATSSQLSTNNPIHNQPATSSQLSTNNLISNRPRHPVMRLTPDPPLPLPNALRDSTKTPQSKNMPPPVPQRVISQPPHPPPNQSRPNSTNTAPYKVFDRPPPPPPPGGPIQKTTNQRNSSFDKRFNFPDISLFPEPRRIVSTPGSGLRPDRQSFSSTNQIETRSY